jgi:hypothetical protein
LGFIVLFDIKSRGSLVFVGEGIVGVDGDGWVVGLLLVFGGVWGMGVGFGVGWNGDFEILPDG